MTEGGHELGRDREGVGLRMGQGVVGRGGVELRREPSDRHAARRLCYI